MVLQLPPGAHLLRRRDNRWQVGLDPARTIVLPEPTAAGDAAVHSDVAALLASGSAPLVSALRTVLPPAGACPPEVRHTLAAVAREAGDECAAVLDRRGRHVVRVETFGPPLSTALGQELLTLCDRTALRSPEPARPGPKPRGARAAFPLVVLVGVGEPSRDLLDRHLREEVAHLLVRLVEGRAVVGPFVVPGRTPCLRCIDAHLTDADPSWPLLVEQYARAVRTDRSDGVPEPVDAALASVSLAWAARDLATYAEGATPTTLASTIHLAPRLETVETRRWSAHARCGCGWG